MAATNEQVQQWSNERVRPYAERLRAVLLSSEDNNASISEVYANLTNSPDWTDNHNGNPPSLLTPNDLLAINTFSSNIANLLRNGGTSGSLTDQQRIDAVKAMADQLPILIKACVQPAV